MKKIELLLPAGNLDNLRAAVNNGADAVYLGMSKFNARMGADNFNENNISSIIKYCHDRNVKVYVTFNTLIKNTEIKDWLKQISIVNSAKADAIIIQDVCMIEILKKNFPKLPIHLSTQSAMMNSQSIPKGVERVILPRELSISQVKNISKNFETEAFVHGALCISYSGICLFSSMVGDRSGNRGRCAQPCRKKYNNKYLLSTKDLCLLEKIPELIEAGISSLKVEGRLKSPLYVGTVARIYRKYIDMYYDKKFKVDSKDIITLKLVFNREFTTGFLYNDSIVDPRQPMNRGLFIGVAKDGVLLLREPLKVGEGVGVWINDKVIGFKIKSIVLIDNKKVTSVKAGDKIKFNYDGPVYKTSSDLTVDLGDDIKIKKEIVQISDVKTPEIKNKENDDSLKLFAKVYNKKSAIATNADVIYYDILKDDCAKVKEMIKQGKFFVYTPRVLSDEEVILIKDKIDEVNPDGVLVSNPGLLKVLDKKYEIHLDYNFNVTNDIDIDSLNGIPIVSPELTLSEIKGLKNKQLICLVHGDSVLMTTKEPIKAPELIDESDRHFKVRKYHSYNEILNCNQIGLFNKIHDLVDLGVKYFFIDTNKEPEKFVRIYKKILSGVKFVDKKIKKGYTTGHYYRSVE